MKLANSVLDLTQYIQPYPQLEKIDTEAIIREFNIANNPAGNTGFLRSNKSPSMEVKQAISHIRESSSAANRNWVFRTYDHPNNIQKFYANKMHRPHWEIISQTANSIQMRSGKMLLKILFPNNPDGTLLIYSLHHYF